MFDTKLDPLTSEMDLDPSIELVPTNVPGAYSKMRISGKSAKSSSIASLFHPSTLASLMKSDSPGASAFRERVLARKWRPEDQIVPLLGPRKGVKHAFENPGGVDAALVDAASIGNNWAGGVIPGGPWTEAYGIWQVPSVSKPATPQGKTGGWKSSSWVGIDGGPGGFSTDVLQAGVAQNVSSEGTPSYYAWFEWYVLNATSPAYVFETSIDNIQIEPGDEVFCVVTYVITPGVGQQGELHFGNSTRGHYFSMVLAPPAGATFNGGSAEWIMEAPGTSAGLGEPTTSLPRFSPVVFSTAYSNGLNIPTGDPNNGNTTNIQGFGELQTSVSLQPFRVEIDYIGSNWLYQPLGPVVGAVPVAARTSPTAWFTPADNFQHIAYVGVDKNGLLIHELFYNIATQGPWGSNLPSRAHNAVAVAAGTSPTSWLTPSDNFEHIAHLSTGGANNRDLLIHELFFQANSTGAWLHNFPSMAAGAKSVAAGTSPTGWFTPTDNVEHIAYVGNDLLIHELFFKIGANLPWQSNEQILRAVGAVPAAAGTSPIAWFTPTDNFEHVAYVGSDFLIHELFFQPNGDGAWRHTRAGADAGAVSVAAGTSPTGWFTPTDNVQHIAYVGSDHQIHELFFKIGANLPWQRNEQIHRALGAVPAAAGTSPMAWFTPTDNFEHVAYVGNDFLIHELFFQPNGDGAWRHNPAGAAAGALTVAAGTSPAGWFTPTDNVQHIAYIGSDAFIHELFFRIG